MAFAATARLGIFGSITDQYNVVMGLEYIVPIESSSCSSSMSVLFATLSDLTEHEPTYEATTREWSGITSGKDELRLRKCVCHGCAHGSGM